ncbi:MAG: bifunctional metallophosphatase/5'-nucleotidase, partial [Bdellovibrio sp.]|nr:bifunctional metallophosphatase/5'-nucleotidase [Bdellovibrio sp.]
GLVCEGGKIPNAHIFRKPADPQGECVQKKNSRESEMTDLLMSLPSNTVDAVLSGHSHTIIHHWINDIPVIQGGARNQYYNLIYLTYDFTENKFLRDRTRIEGPVPICPKVFANQGNCDGDELPPAQGRGNLITPTFHGKLVLPDETTETSLKPLFEKYDPIINRVIGHAARPVDHDRKKESEMGNLVTDVIRKKVKADVALFNPGGIRDGLNAGAITFGKLYSILPFENAISVLKLTGKELKLLIRIAENGTRGYFPVSGLKLKLVHLNQDAPSNDINNDGHIEPWEINRLLDIHLENGEKIKDSRFYSLATVDFLVTGGDDMAWIMSQIPSDRIQFDAGGLIRNAVIDFISTNGPLNTVTHPLVDPKNPRFIIVKTHTAKKRKTK